MILKSVTIENFRSIKELEVDIHEISGKRCSIFFGINETGKSNILKAIALLSKDNKFNYNQDCEKGALKQNEDVIIKYIFDIKQEDDINDKIKEINLPEDLMEQIKIKKVEKTIYFNKDSQRKEYYYIYFDNGIQYKTFVHNRKDDKIISKISFTNYIDPEIIRSEKDIQDLFDKEYEVLTDKILDNYIEPKIRTFLDTLLPEVIFWEPSSKYLISDPINLEQFKNNQELSIPLKNMFHLANITGQNLQTNITRMQQNAEIRAEIEETISKEVTKHINELWPEHKINIHVRIEANNLCTVSVEDKDNTKSKFTMNQRSDGFKQFISILLTLSVENKVNQLKNKIILLDEPDRSLHPSSIRYLRDELLNISENNIVLSASHSIYMVDKKNLERHYTVYKEKGETHIERVDPENPLQEEVIYEALGTSIYEIIEPNVIIFEGRTDKDIFDAFTRKLKTRINPVAIKAISATGTKQIPKYVKFFNQNLVKGFVVVDSDQEGRDAKRNVIRENPSFKDTSYEIKDLVTLQKQFVTIEDLFPEDIILSIANDFYKHNFNSPHDKSIIEHIKTIKRSQNINIDTDFEELKTLIVKNIISDINKKKIEDVEQTYPLYIEFLNNLHQKIKDVA